MIAVYDVLIATTPRNAEFGAAKAGIGELARILGVSRNTARRALCDLTRAGYLRLRNRGGGGREKAQYEIVNFNGTEPVGLAREGQQMTRSANDPVSKCPPDGQQMTPRGSANDPLAKESLNVKKEKKEKKRKKEDADFQSAASWFQSLSKSDQDIVDETLGRIGTVYRAGKLSREQQTRIVLQLAKFEPEIAVEACRTWNQRQYEKAKSFRGMTAERYLLGIACNL